MKNLYQDHMLRGRDAGVRYTAVVKKLALNYYGRPNQGPPEMLALTPEEEAHLFRIRRRSAAAREKLVRKYLCWSFKIATKLKGPRLDWDEAVSAANAGLMEAMEGFVPGGSAHFTTYSAIIIRRHVINALIATYPVKVSDHLRKKFAAAKKDPDPKKLEAQLRAGEATTLAELFKRLSATSDFNIETLFEKQEDAPFMPSEGPSPAEEMELSSLSQEIREAIMLLPDPLQRTAIIARHFKSPAESFERIGRRLHVSKTRVREAHDTALESLKKTMIS